MRKLFTDPTIEIKSFAMENIVTISGEAYTEDTIANLKNNNDYARVIVNANQVLHFND